MKWIVLLLAVGGCATTPATDNFGKPFSELVPKDVRAFVIDVQACGHFSGEEPYDAARRAFLEKMIKKTCTDLEARRATLTSRYSSSPAILTEISMVWDQ
jgi:hypothetical protein